MLSSSLLPRYRCRIASSLGRQRTIDVSLIVLFPTQELTLEQLDLLVQSPEEFLVHLEEKGS